MVQQNKMPSKEKVWQLCNNVDMFKLMFTKFLPVLIGCVKHKNSRGIRIISENCTKSDEAFLLLLLDNSWDTWTAHAENALNDQEEEAPTKMAKDENMKCQAPVPKQVDGRSVLSWKESRVVPGGEGGV
jgi:hypothetical protein